MKPAALLVVIVSAVILPTCIKQHNFLHKSNKQKTIAIQPLGNYDSAQLNYLSQEIGTFYNMKCTLLKSLDIPPTFLLAGDEQMYFADSIVQWLSIFLTKDIVEVIGLTHHRIYTYNNEPGSGADRRIIATKTVYGLGFLPGNCCIVSDYKLYSTDSKIYNHRLRTVVLHETGHNLGLKHCNNPSCLMLDKSGLLPLLDNCCMDFCATCRKTL